MILRILMGLALLGSSASGALGQREPPVDSLVTDWVEHGLASGWTPGYLFQGCPNLAEWQQRGIRRLMSAELPIERTNDLGRAWAKALRDCHNPRLEQWFFDRLDQAITRGDSGRLLALRMAFERANSPGIRAYLRNRFLDASLPEDVRNTWGELYFEKLAPDEVRREFLSAFETQRLTYDAGWGLADHLLREDPDRLLREVAPLVRANPALANQSAFAQIVQVGYHMASDEARRELGDALAAGLAGAGAGMPERLRQRLESTVQDLRRPHPGGRSGRGRSRT